MVFVLLRFDPAAEIDPLVSAAIARGVSLRSMDIADPAIAALYGRKLVLVRPDAHVCWRADNLPNAPDQLIATVAGFA